jgi:hypothetical protein
MADRVLRECSAPIPKNVALKVIFGYFLDGPDPLIPPVLNAVEPFL